MKATHWILSLLTASSVVGGAAWAAAPSGGGLSFLACHKAFQDAKKSGALNGQGYNDFKKGHCTASPAVEAKPPAPPSSASEASLGTKAQSSGAVVYPQKILPQFSSLSAGKARMQTCLTQYKANQSNGANAGLKWIEKGGGYYSQCNARLKGAAGQ